MARSITNARVRTLAVVLCLATALTAACTDPDAETGRARPGATPSDLFAPPPREPDFARDTGTVVQSIPSAPDSSPSGAAVGLGAVWVTEFGAKDIVRIDPAAGRITARIAIPVDPTHGGRIERAPTVAPGGVWLCVEGNDLLVRIDAATNAVAGQFGAPCRGLSAGPLGLWAGLAPGTLARYDDTTGAVLRRIQVPTEPTLVAQGFGSLWTYSGEQHTLHRVDPASGKVIATVRFGSGGSLVVGTRAVYVADAQADTITVLDPKTNRVSRVLSVPGNDRLDPILTFGEGAVWVSTLSGGLARLDEKRLVLTTSVQLNRQNRPTQPAAGLGFIWFPTYGNDSILKVRLLR